MKTKAIAAAALLVATVPPWRTRLITSNTASFIGNETNVLNLVGIFGLVGIRGCVTVDNTGNAVVQSSQMVDAHGVHLTGPLLGSYVTGDVTYGVHSRPPRSRTRVAHTCSLARPGRRSTTRRRG